MRNSWLAVFAVGVVFFCASGTASFGQDQNPPKKFVERTVTHRSTKFGFGGTVGSSLVSERKTKAGTTSKATSPSKNPVKLPKLVGVPVQIEAKVYQLDMPPPLTTGSVIPQILTVSEALRQIEAGQHQLIASPSIVGSSGNSTSFQSIVNVTLAKEYSPPTIPKSYDGVITGGIAIGDKTPLKTNDSELILPPHPNAFEARDIGLTFKFVPKIEKDGTVSVVCDVENTALGPFADRGTKILRETKKLIGKKTKTEVMLENNQFYPTILSQKMSFTASGKMGSSASKMTKAVSGVGQFTAIHGKVPRAGDFAEIIVRDGLPPLLVSVGATKIEVAKPDKKIRAADNAQVYLTVRAIEVSEELNLVSGLPQISSGILTDPQFQVFIRALNQKKGVDLLTAPSLMMAQNQAGQVEVVREFIYPTKYSAPELPEPKKVDPKEKGERWANGFPVTPATPLEFTTTKTGIDIGVMARPTADGSIELQLKPEVTEFKGFLNFGEPILIHDYEKAFGKTISVVMTENRIEMPIFEKRGLETTVRIPDGGTVCLGGFVLNEIQDVQDKVPFLGDLPLVGRSFRKDIELHTQRRLYFFVRAELMDPAGVPITKK